MGESALILNSPAMLENTVAVISTSGVFTPHWNWCSVRPEYAERLCSSWTSPSVSAPGSTHSIRAAGESGSHGLSPDLSSASCWSNVVANSSSEMGRTNRPAQLIPKMAVSQFLKRECMTARKW